MRFVIFFQQGGCHPPSDRALPTNIALLKNVLIFKSYCFPFFKTLLSGLNNIFNVLLHGAVIIDRCSYNMISTLKHPSALCKLSSMLSMQKRVQCMSILYAGGLVVKFSLESDCE